MDDGPGCVLVLIGLPAAGKSTLCRALERDADGWRVASVRFDDDLEAATVDADFDPERWHASRAAALARVEALLRAAGPEDGAAPRLVVVDDNMQYRSMRHRLFQMARDARTRLARAWVRLPLAAAVARNDAARGGRGRGRGGRGRARGAVRDHPEDARANGARASRRGETREYARSPPPPPRAAARAAGLTRARRHRCPPPRPGAARADRFPWERFSLTLDTADGAPRSGGGRRPTPRTSGRARRPTPPRTTRAPATTRARRSRRGRPPSSRACGGSCARARAAAAAAAAAARRRGARARARGDRGERAARPTCGCATSCAT